MGAAALAQRGVRDCSVHVSEMGDNLNAVDLDEDSSLVEVVAGDSSMCSLFENGKVKCWGMAIQDDSAAEAPKLLGMGQGRWGATFKLLYWVPAFQRRILTALVSFVALFRMPGSVKCWGPGSSYGSAVGWRPGDNNHVGDEPGERWETI